MSTAITVGIIGDDTNVLTGAEGEGIQATALTRMACDAVTIMTGETASNSPLSIPGLIHVTLTHIFPLGHRRPHPLSNPPTYCNPRPNAALSTATKLYVPSESSRPPVRCCAFYVTSLAAYIIFLPRFARGIIFIRPWYDSLHF